MVPQGVIVHYSQEALSLRQTKNVPQTVVEFGSINPVSIGGPIKNAAVDAANPRGILDTLLILFGRK
jgi:hypothetical protein